MSAIPFLDLGAMSAEIRAELDQAWDDVTGTSSFIGGRFVERFERSWADYCGRRHGLGTADGTAALELALRALGIGPGDEVIVPANTFIATVEAVLGVGALPVLVDVDPDTLLLTAAHVEAALTPRTAAVIPVHLFGQPCDMDAIGAVAAKAGLAVIEDAAQAHGASWRGRRVGSFGDLACFSFYPGKNLGAFGDAGAVVTDRDDLAARIRCLGNHGRDPAAAERHLLVGRNQRLDALQAAVLSAKLPRLDAWNAARQRLAARYAKGLAGSAARMVTVAEGAVSVHHLAVVQVEDRDAVRRALAAEGIATGIHYAIPCHLQPALAHLRTAPLPVTEAAATRILSLPMFPHLTDAQVDRVVEALRRATDSDIAAAA
ncbi:MAG: DegT/DnrJ/EryC1/StrS family aminotransferase [Geminicoccaceae bacterium]